LVKKMSITKSIANEKSTLVLCGESCFKNPKCSYFSFNHKTLTCYLKKADKIKMSQESIGLICGRIPSRIKSRSWFSATGYQWDSGCDFRGNDFITKPMSTHTDCGEACKADTNCNYFTFNRLRSICFLKKWPGFFTESSKNADGAVCGFIPSRKQFKEEAIIKSIKATTTEVTATTASRNKVEEGIKEKSITTKQAPQIIVNTVRSVFARKETTKKETISVKSVTPDKEATTKSSSASKVSSATDEDEYEDCDD